MLRIIPTRQQWNGWHLPSKYGVIGSLLTLVFGLLSIVFWLWPLWPRPDWVRVTYVDTLAFESVEAAGSYGRTVWPHGPVKGSVSDPRLAVFVLIRMIPAEGATRDASDDSWGIAEAVVDAEGNWKAEVCFSPHTYIGRAPDYEDWEIIAFATNEAQAIRKATAPEVCSIVERDLRTIGSLICSETKVVARPPDSGGGYYMGRRPQPRNYCFR